jgi:hypothetical protein
MLLDMTTIDRSARLLFALGLSGIAAVGTYAVGGWALRGIVAVGLAVVPA